MKKIVFFLFIYTVISLNANSQNEKFKALFIFNFTKYIEWPASQKNGDFVIGIFGITSLSKELEIIASKQRIGNQKIVVKTFSSIKNIQKCHILYIAPAKSNSISQVLSAIGKNNTLVISDRQGMASKGAGINYIMVGDRLDYEININNIENKGLIVSTSLLALGRTVKK